MKRLILESLNYILIIKRIKKKKTRKKQEKPRSRSKISKRMYVILEYYLNKNKRISKFETQGTIPGNSISERGCHIRITFSRISQDTRTPATTFPPPGRRSRSKEQDEAVGTTAQV